MKTLIVYYSLSGNHRLLAQALSKRFNCPAHELRPRKPRTMFDLFLDAFLYRAPPNDRIPYDVAEYDRVILVAPVWNMRIAAPLRSFARQHGGHLGNYGFITACAGRPHQAARLQRELTRFVGRGPKRLAQLEIGALLPPEQQKGRSASTYRLKPADLEAFAPKIDDFLAAMGGPDVPPPALERPLKIVGGTGRGATLAQSASTKD